MIDGIKDTINMQDANKPMRKSYVKGQNGDMNLGDPYGKMSCLILYLYSMELGSPPLYSEINRVCRTMDKSQILNLGPYIKALGVVTYFSEINRDDSDKIATGEMKLQEKKGTSVKNLGQKDQFQYNLAGLFILYRGTNMQATWIDEYRGLVEHEASKYGYVSLSGSSSCTQNLTIALNFAFKNIQEAQEDMKSVLFVISCQNYKGYQGFRLNNAGYTAYPLEEEVLLVEGCEVVILSVVADFEIPRESRAFEPYNGKYVTMIHVFLPDKTCEHANHQQDDDPRISVVLDNLQLEQFPRQVGRSIKEKSDGRRRTVLLNSALKLSKQVSLN